VRNRTDCTDCLISKAGQFVLAGGTSMYGAMKVWNLRWQRAEYRMDQQKRGRGSDMGAWRITYWGEGCGEWHAE